MNKTDYIIRTETPKDHRQVENLTREAFWNQSEPGCCEHYFVHKMRDHEDFIPELALVLEKGGKIIANIMYTKSWLVDEDGNRKTILTFGPVSVLPEFKRCGFGKAIMERSFEIARDLGYEAIVIFGNPDNYVARGFKCCIKYEVCLEGDVFPAALLVKELKEGFFDGRKYFYCGSTAEECCNDLEAVAAYDAGFPPKEKAWQPSQEEFFIHSHSVIVRR